MRIPSLIKMVVMMIIVTSCGVIHNDANTAKPNSASFLASIAANMETSEDLTSLTTSSDDSQSTLGETCPRVDVIIYSTDPCSWCDKLKAAIEPLKKDPGGFKVIPGSGPSPSGSYPYTIIKIYDKNCIPTTKGPFDGYSDEILKAIKDAVKSISGKSSQNMDLDSSINIDSSSKFNMKDTIEPPLAEVDNSELEAYCKNLVKFIVTFIYSPPKNRNEELMLDGHCSTYYNKCAATGIGSLVYPRISEFCKYNELVK